jgi:hypothetical protein
MKPAAAFATSKLEIETIAAGRRFGRLYLDHFPNLHRDPDPLGYGKTPSRFSDPRRRIAGNRFGVVYLGESLKVCFLEAVLRDLRNGAIGEFPLSENELHIRNYVDVEIASELKLVDLRGDAAIRMCRAMLPAPRIKVSGAHGRSLSMNIRRSPTASSTRLD